MGEIKETKKAMGNFLGEKPPVTIKEEAEKA